MFGYLFNFYKNQSLGKVSFEWEWEDLLVTHTVDRSFFQFGLAQFLIKKLHPDLKKNKQPIGYTFTVLYDISKFRVIRQLHGLS